MPPPLNIPAEKGENIAPRPEARAAAGEKEMAGCELLGAKAAGWEIMPEVALAVGPGKPGTPKPPLSTNRLPPVGVGTSVPWIDPWQFVHRSTSGKLASSWWSE